MSADSAAPDAAAIETALRQVIDPEIGVNIVDLGLVYRIAAGAAGVVVEMTLTSPACPLGDLLLEEVEAALRRALPPALPVDLRLVWSPPWEPARMSEAARRQLEG